MIDWKIEAITDFGEVISGGTPATNIPDYWGGDIVWVTPADLSKIHFAPLWTSEKKITKMGLSNSSANLIPKKSIVISSRAPIGYIAVPEVDFSTNQGCKSVKLKPGHDPIFHYFNFKQHIEEFKRRGEGTTFAEIS
ncbi:MAG: type restriction enzyme subunit, partial [Clostridiales bacterium]|nr:type restriction enzyme subunit [Clostridiales bacterium]MDN5281989.1 type restriction enzyme subunit [Candidatus Ozemobacter sp.]